MTLKANLQATGASYGHSQAICGELGPYLAAAGGSQATATLLPRLTRHVVTSGTGGVILPGAQLGDYLQDGDETEISNTTAFTISVYPPLGAAFSGSAVNIPVSLAAGYSVSVLVLSQTLYMPRYYATQSGAGSVSSVGLALPTEFSVTGSPVTNSGTLTGAWVSQNQNRVFAAPSGSAGTPSFRLLVTSDIPALSYAPLTSGTSILSGNGTGGFSNVTIGTNLSFVGGTLSATGAGSVTSVGLSLPSIITVSGSPVTTTGTLTGTLATQNANLVWAGPSSAPAAQPTFRSIVSADLPGNVVYTTGSPANGNLTAFTGANTVSNSNLSGDVTTSGTLAATVKANLKTADIAFIIDGGGAAITTGIKGDLQINFDCTITANTVLLDQSGSIVIDIWKDTYANYPPTGADSICASAKPTVSTATKSTDSTLTGWTTSITAGQTLRFNVDSITSATRALIDLKVVKT